MLVRDLTLIQRPLPEAELQPLIVPTQWIIHTAVDAPGPTNLYGYFERRDITLESHTWLRWDRHEQFMPFNRRADANYLANRRPDGTGAISTETEDDGDPVGKPWNAYQLGELVRFGTLLVRERILPARLCRTPSDPGIGYHALFPGVWSNVAGKTCPGPTRIAQLKTIVLPAIVRGSGISPEPDPTEDIVDRIIFFTNGAGGNHAYRCTGGIGKYLPTAQAIGALEFIGIKRANQPSAPWDKNLVAGFALLDGPLKNV